MGANEIALRKPGSSMLVDSAGNPFSITAHRARPAHEAASRVSAELASWNAPSMLNADGELLGELETLRDRTKDMIRNNGLMSGAVQTHLDNVIGSGLRLNATPGWRELGITDPDVQLEWELQTETLWRRYSEDIDCNIDAMRQRPFGALMAQAYRSYLTSFEILATAEWVEDPYFYNTRIQLVDPVRLSNPEGAPDDDFLRAGVRKDGYGAPIGYWISTEHSQPGIQSNARSWKYVPRNTPWGRMQCIHIFENDGIGASRGKSGIVSALLRGKMVEKFDKVTLEASILNAMYAAVIESSLDWQATAAAMGAGVEGQDPTFNYMQNRATFHQEGNIRFNGLKIPHLYPGENLKLMVPQHPGAAFDKFHQLADRYMAAAFNMTYEQYSRDYSQTNYSSGRAALMEVWKFFNGRQQFVAAPVARHWYALWLEEAIDIGDVKLPAGAPDFYAAKDAWTRCQWIGPGRGSLDPEKDSNAKKLNYGMYQTTLQEMAAEDGKDWRDIIDQRAREDAYMKSKGVDPQPMQDSALNTKPSAPGKDKPAERGPNGGSKE